MKSRATLLIVGTLILGAIALCAWGIGRDDRTTVAGLIRRLKDGAKGNRRDAATALGHLTGPGAGVGAQALIEALRDADAEVRARSARSLGTLLANNPASSNLDASSRILGQALLDSRPAVRASAAVGLRSLGREMAGMFEAAIEGLRGDDPTLRSESEAVLSALAIWEPGDLRRMLALLDDPDAAVREAARKALTRRELSLNAVTALDVLASTLKAGSDGAREVAATMLGRVPTGRDLLVIAVRDAAPRVRLAASAAMGSFSEDPIARFALRLATDDPDLGVRATASASLALGRHATKAEALADLRIALKNDDARADLADEIETNPDRATPRLIVALRDDNPRVRAAAARCLGEVARRSENMESFIVALTLALSDRDPFVRRASAASLGRHGPDAGLATEALKQAISDADRGVSGQAFLTLRGLEEMQVR